MADQELKFFQEPQEEEHMYTSLIHLSDAAAAVTLPHKPTSEYSNSSKRHSPLSPPLFQEPHSNRATLYPPSSTSAAATDLPYFGFTKLQLPRAFPAASSPPLRRTVSEPVYSAPPPNISEFPSSPGPSTANQPPENTSRNITQETVQFPNPGSVIHRTVSDPSPIVNRQAVSGTPPRPPVVRNTSRSPGCGESPSTKRLKRMKERLREMSQWWNQIVNEGEDEEDNECGNGNTDIIPKEVSEMENPLQEAVWVENNGDCLVLHFKCPCGNGYQILLSGKNCYYKLTNF